MEAAGSRRDPNTLVDDAYFFYFQNVLERKQNTLLKLNELNQKFIIKDHFCFSWFNMMWRQISKIKQTILSTLSENNSVVCFQGEHHSMKDLMKTYQRIDFLETYQQDHDRPFQVYLESQLGYLTSDQITKLEDLHRKLNENLHELYGSMEYHKMSGG